MNVGRRKKSLQKLLERFINDYQKENCHRDGLKRIEDASIKSDVDISSRVLQVNNLSFFQIQNRKKTFCCSQHQC